MTPKLPTDKHRLIPPWWLRKNALPWDGMFQRPDWGDEWFESGWRGKIVPEGDLQQFIYCTALPIDFGQEEEHEPVKLTAHDAAVAIVRYFDRSWVNWSEELRISEAERVINKLLASTADPRSGETLEQLRAKHQSSVAETQREIRESSQMSAEDLSIRVGSATSASEVPTPSEFARSREGVGG